MNKTLKLYSFKDKDMCEIKELNATSIKLIENYENILRKFDERFFLFYCIQENYNSFNDDLSSFVKDIKVEESHIASINFIKINRIFNRGLINILAAFKTMLEHLETSIKREFGEESNEINFFKKIQKDEFDNNFSYSFCYKLRNYIQHCSTPSLKFSLEYSRNNSDEPTVSSKFHFNRDDLIKNYDSWGPVKERLSLKEETFCVFTVLNELINSITRIFIEMKEIFQFEQIKKAKNYIISLLNEEEGYIGQDYAIGIFDKEKGLKANMIKTSLLKSFNDFNEIINSY
ncbi:hypothetical protein RMB03_18475 [Acinetobacter sp. V91_7]|uniref:hypothetical protein n=1 Tax=unclassified Acinetobacter TaxID=196816 RepID=UPI00287DBB9E|nr:MULTISPECIES: hypothetical protein [unclassified Acinetobacter]MDS7933331.1 hypothetical protein [Acinetobacter sp. V91_4B]MDS7964935.1 hypothetical protein [Acinetobacter sp. V91_7]MDS8027858.1 hypothetical protein [Acinetobacter sp. V91_13]